MKGTTSREALRDVKIASPNPNLMLTILNSSRLVVDPASSLRELNVWTAADLSGFFGVAMFVGSLRFEAAPSDAADAWLDAMVRPDVVKDSASSIGARIAMMGKGRSI